MSARTAESGLKGYSRRKLLSGLVVVLVAIATFSNVFDNGFHYDDFHTIVDNPHIRNLDRVAAFFADSATFASMEERAMYRPLASLSFALNYRLSGTDVFGYHVVNLLLHVGCTALLYGLATAIGLTWREAMVGIALFSLHPVQSEVVNYISSRSESLAALFSLSALFLYVRWRSISAATTGEGGHRSVLHLASIVCFGAALASKSTALALPPIILLYDLLRRPLPEAGSVVRRHWLFWALAVGYVYIVWGAASAALGQPVRGLHVQLLSQLKALIYYAKLLVMPAGLSVEHQFVAADLTSSAALLSVAVLASITCVIIARRRALNMRRMWLASAALVALMPASLVPLNVLVNEHRLYLSIAFACLAVATFRSMERANGKREPSGFSPSVRTVCMVVAVALFALLSHDRNRAWASEEILWRDAVLKAPHMYRSHLHLGGALERTGDSVAALPHYEQAAVVDPEVALVHYNLGNALLNGGRVEEARRRFARALELNGDFLPALVNLAGLELSAGRIARAQALLARARSSHPNASVVHSQQAALYRSTGDFQEAVGSYRRAIELDGTSVAAHFNLANLQFELGLQQRAVRLLRDSVALYKTALALAPTHRGVRLNLVDALVRLGDYHLAEEICSVGLSRGKAADRRLFLPLARAQEGLGKCRDANKSYRRYADGLDVEDAALSAVEELIVGLADVDGEECR